MPVLARKLAGILLRWGADCKKAIRDREAWRLDHADVVGRVAANQRVGSRPRRGGGVIHRINSRINSAAHTGSLDGLLTGRAVYHAKDAMIIDDR